MTGLFRLSIINRALHSVSRKVLSVQRAAVEREQCVTHRRSAYLLTHAHTREGIATCVRSDSYSRALDTVARSHILYISMRTIQMYTFLNTPPYIYIVHLSIYYIMFNNLLNFSNLSLHNAFVKISAILLFESILIITISFSFTLS